MFKDMGMRSELDSASIYQVQTGKKILSKPVYQDYIESLSKQIGQSKDLYKALYVQLIENYAQFVQQLEKPRDKMRTPQLHSGLRRSFGFIRQVMPIIWANDGFGFDPERLVYALYSAALLHGIGRTLQDRMVVKCDEAGKYKGIWFPNVGLLEEGYYKVRAIKTLPEDYVRSLHTIYAQTILPKLGLAWLLEDPKLFIWWQVALEDLQRGFSEFEIDLNIDKLEEDVEEFNFDKFPPSIVPPETLEGEKFFAWLKDYIKNNSQLINQTGSGLTHGKQGLLLEIDILIAEYVKSSHVGKASAGLIKSEFNSLGVASSSQRYAKTTSGFLQSTQQSEFMALLIEYEKGLFESGTLGPVMQVSSQSQVSSGERFFTRVGGIAQQFMLGHTTRGKQ